MGNNESTPNNYSKTLKQISNGKDNNPLFKYKDDRKFLKKASMYYFLPIDELESDRMQLRHDVEWHVWRTNFSSPIETTLKLGGAQILDVACGSGLWALEMASDYPLSEFVGVDVAPIFPSDVMPPNVTFKQCDILERLPYSDCSFYYIHIKDLFQYFPLKIIRDQIFPDLVRILKPGGWIEIQDRDPNMINAGPICKRLEDMLSLSFLNRGIHVKNHYDDMEKLFKKNNLIKYRSDKKSIPYADLDLALQDFLSTYKAMKFTLTEYSGATAEEFEEIVENASKELIPCNAEFVSRKYFEITPGE
ncbi:7180_t:CDS:2 [Cetraspora pellucida]|uniref:7180_t:CDS:1 n=1 Tax=Cetraspora pellucida TaxID=1433469 RepID=A0ACA9LIE5_9GLOM|nr:7180_t:CDS:2 [Cetraspora pellucida]